MAESLVDSYKTELIADRVWRTRSQLELATIEWVGWYNHTRLHEALGDIPPVAFEQLHAATTTIPGNRSVAGTSPRPAEALTTRRVSIVDADFVARPLDRSDNGSIVRGAGLRPPPAWSIDERSPLASPTGSLRSSTHTMKRETH